MVAALVVALVVAVKVAAFVAVEHKQLSLVPLGLPYFGNMLVDTMVHIAVNILLRMFERFAIRGFAIPVCSDSMLADTMVHIAENNQPDNIVVVMELVGVEMVVVVADIASSMYLGSTMVHTTEHTGLNIPLDMEIIEEELVSE